MSTITLTTDYGTKDWYVGVLKGVIGQMAPQARLVDITHEIEPQNVRHAAFVLARIWPWFETGTIHVAVVDPGVGTDRGIIVGRFADRFLVAPDNGLATLVNAEHECQQVHIARAERFFLPTVSSTFHGRDIMAPVAAHLANGVALDEFGPRLDRITPLEMDCRAKRVADRLVGGVLYVDRFGTLITNIGADQIAGLSAEARGSAPVVSVEGGAELPLRATFADVPPGQVVALIGGSGVLEIAVNQGRAVDRFGPKPRIEVVPG